MQTTLTPAPTGHDVHAHPDPQTVNCLLWLSTWLAAASPPLFELGLAPHWDPLLTTVLASSLIACYPRWPLHFQSQIFIKEIIAARSQMACQDCWQARSFMEQGSRKAWVGLHELDFCLQYWWRQIIIYVTIAEWWGWWFDMGVISNNINRGKKCLNEADTFYV